MNILRAAKQATMRERYESQILVEDTGFTVVDKNLPDDYVRTDEIIAIVAYKMDQIVADLICCDVFTRSGKDELVRTVHEEMQGFDMLMRSFASLPGFDQEWWPKVVQPAFAKNRTVLYEVGLR